MRVRVSRRDTLNGDSKNSRLLLRMEFAEFVVTLVIPDSSLPLCSPLPFYIRPISPPFATLAHKRFPRF